MKRILLLVFVSLLLLAGVANQRHALACEFVSASRWHSGGDRVYIQRSLTALQQQQLLEELHQARTRIAATFGPMVSTPKMVVTADERTAARLGANATASMHRAPRPCIVIGPQGHSRDVMAHELLHAEIQFRTGLLAHMREIPIWFDEGVALMVDHRLSFLPENIDMGQAEVEAVTELFRARAFFSQEDLRAGYQAARLAAEVRLGDRDLYQGLARIRQGERFEQVFTPSVKEST